MNFRNKPKAGQETVVSAGRFIGSVSGHSKISQGGIAASRLRRVGRKKDKFRLGKAPDR
jgi:hypothetical protein